MLYLVILLAVIVLSPFILLAITIISNKQNNPARHDNLYPIIYTANGKVSAKYGLSRSNRRIL